MKVLEKILLFVVVVVSGYLGINNIFNNNLYDALICFSAIPIIFIPYILRKIKINISSVNTSLYVIFIFIAQFLGSVLKLYNYISWFDLFAHMFSGILISSLALEYLIKIKKANNKKFNILFIVAITLMCASLWEFFEFFADKISGGNAQHVLETGVDDTMEDMLIGLFGSLFYSGIYLLERKKIRRK